MSTFVWAFVSLIMLGLGFVLGASAAGALAVRRGFIVHDSKRYAVDVRTTEVDTETGRVRAVVREELRKGTFDGEIFKAMRRNEQRGIK